MPENVFMRILWRMQQKFNSFPLLIKLLVAGIALVTLWSMWQVNQENSRRQNDMNAAPRRTSHRSTNQNSP